MIIPIDRARRATAASPDPETELMKSRAAHPSSGPPLAWRSAEQSQQGLVISKAEPGVLVLRGKAS